MTTYYIYFHKVGRYYEIIDEEIYIMDDLRRYSIIPIKAIDGEEINWDIEDPDYDFKTNLLYARNIHTGEKRRI